MQNFYYMNFIQEKQLNIKLLNNHLKNECNTLFYCVLGLLPRTLVGKIEICQLIINPSK